MDTASGENCPPPFVCADTPAAEAKRLNRKYVQLWVSGHPLRANGPILLRTSQFTPCLAE
jgi:hypothetical protein